jgi:hypothetical protein
LSTDRVRLDLWCKDQNNTFDNIFSNKYSLFQLETKKNNFYKQYWPYMVCRNNFIRKIIQSDLAIRNFLVSLKLFLTPNVPYKVNWQLVTENGSLTPTCSLSPSLTVYKKPAILKHFYLCNKVCVTEKSVNQLKYPIFWKFYCQYPLINHFVWHADKKETKVENIQLLSLIINHVVIKNFSIWLLTIFQEWTRSHVGNQSLPRKKKIDLVRDVNIQVLKKYDFIPFFQYLDA